MTISYGFFFLLVLWWDFSLLHINQTPHGTPSCPYHNLDPWLGGRWIQLMAGLMYIRWILYVGSRYDNYQQEWWSITLYSNYIWCTQKSYTNGCYATVSPQWTVFSYLLSWRTFSSVQHVIHCNIRTFLQGSNKIRNAQRAPNATSCAVIAT